MSQILKINGINSRGRAYKCLRCTGLQPQVDQKKRLQSILYKEHVTITQAPFYCHACLFKCQDMDTLLKHIPPNVYLPHAIKMDALRANGFPTLSDHEVLIKSNNPYYLTEGVDFIQLSVEESNSTWRSRARSLPQAECGLPSIPSSTNAFPLITQATLPPLPDCSIISSGPTTPLPPATTHQPAQTLFTSQLPPITVPVVPLSFTPPVTNVFDFIMDGFDADETISVAPVSTAPLPTPVGQPIYVAPTQETVEPTTPTPYVPAGLVADRPTYVPTKQPGSSNAVAEAINLMSTNISNHLDQHTTALGTLNGTLRSMLVRLEERERRLAERERRLDNRERMMDEKEQRKEDNQTDHEQTTDDQKKDGW